MFRRLKLIILLAMFGLPNIARGALPTEGTWPATTVGNQTVNLTGDISLKGTITIPDGKTLTINANGATRHITNMASSSLAEGMFVIQKGGKLVINGTEEYSVVIDGGANYQTPINYNNGFLDKASLLVYASDTHRSMKKPAIRNSGTLIMEYVTVRNEYNSCASDVSLAQKAGAVLHAGLSGTVKTTLTNCVVERCKSPLGSGLFMCSESVGTVTLTDCEFRDCVSTETKGATSTGTIRSFGDTETSLNKSIYIKIFC